MAAILCESLGKLLHGFCDAFGSVLTLPCKACGIATGQITKVCSSPFCLYLTVASALNIPPIIFAGKSLGVGNDSDDCSSAGIWLYVNALLCLINIAAALYMSAKITYEPEDENAAPFVEATVANKEANTKEQPEKTIVRKILEDSLVNDSRSRSYARVRDILCYDPAVALYIIIGLFYMVWQTMGYSRSRDAVDCEGGLDESVENSIMCGFLFISIGGMAFAISLCCMAR